MIEPGTWVYYHGSIEEHHGYMRVVKPHYPFAAISDQDTVRYMLQYGPKMYQYLQNVRPESFTVFDELFKNTKDGTPTP